MEINGDRLWADIQDLGRIGAQPEGGVTRFPFTKEDREAENWLAAKMREAGLSVTFDAAGNVKGLWDGSEQGLAPVICGSHYDTVKNGGKFDGCLGILAGLEALRTMKRMGTRTRRPILLIGFKDEEGNRFGAGMVGSKSVCGVFDHGNLKGRDSRGVSLGQAMREAGRRPDALEECRISPVKAYLELHIEQGSVLEKANRQIGIVEGIAGLLRYRVRFSGESGHAGAVPMGDRKDPVTAAARWICRVTELACRRQSCVATVGSIETAPGVYNVICGQVRLTLDLRSVRERDLEEIALEMEGFGRELYRSCRVAVEMVKEQELPPCLCDERLMRKAAEFCQEEGYSHLKLMSGAGHDCMNFKDVCPTAMLFVPSAGGYSHRKEEYTPPEDCARGAQILLRMLVHAGNLE